MPLFHQPRKATRHSTEVTFCIFHFFLILSGRSEGSDSGQELGCRLEAFLGCVIRTETKPYPLPAGGNNSPLAFRSGLCGDGVGEGDGEDEKDRDLERNERSLSSVFGAAEGFRSPQQCTKPTTPSFGW